MTLDKFRATRRGRILEWCDGQQTPLPRKCGGILPAWGGHDARRGGAATQVTVMARMAMPQAAACHGHPARQGDMAGMAMPQGPTLERAVGPRDVQPFKGVSCESWES
jgi:hypothetical protein